MSGSAAYIWREAMISAGINAAISAGFFLAVFGLVTSVPVWGIGNFAFDLLPQSFAVSVFASLVPALLTRKALLAGRLDGVFRPVDGVGAIVRSALLMALAMTIIGAGLCAGVLWLSGVSALKPVTALILKVFYGGALGAVVTRLRLQSMIAP